MSLQVFEGMRGWGRALFEYHTFRVVTVLSSLLRIGSLGRVGSLTRLRQHKHALRRSRAITGVDRRYWDGNRFCSECTIRRQAMFASGRFGRIFRQR